MSYSFESRVRFSEIGEKGCLTLPGVLDYFQDCCTFESEQTGLGMEGLKAQKRAWVLSAWQVIVKRYPKLGENINVTTIPYGFQVHSDILFYVPSSDYTSLRQPHEAMYPDLPYHDSGELLQFHS